MVRSSESFERFCGRLVLDSGRPMTLESFQKRMLADFFQNCRESVACIAKGAGKTTLLAALALYELVSDPGCEGAVCAASRDQAGLLLAQARGFVERTPGLASRVRIMRREAINRKTGGRFRVLASDVDTLDGLILSFGVADELHRWRASEAYAILLAAVQKLGGRLFGISTAGVKGGGLLWAMRERAIELGAKRDSAYLGLRTPRFAWHEWSLGDGDFRDIAQVKACNPASWVTEEVLRERFESPSMTDIDFRRFRANQWVERRELASIFDAGTWAALVDTHAQPLPPLCFAADAGMDRSSAASLIPRVQEFGLEVIGVSTREVAQACGGFYDAVSNGTLRHRGSAPLDTSIAGAVKRSLAQSWALDRKKSIADPAPAMAAVLAHFGLLTRGPISQAAYDQQFGEQVIV